MDRFFVAVVGLSLLIGLSLASYSRVDIELNSVTESDSLTSSLEEGDRKSHKENQEKSSRNKAKEIESFEKHVRRNLEGENYRSDRVVYVEVESGFSPGNIDTETYRIYLGSGKVEEFSVSGGGNIPYGHKLGPEEVLSLTSSRFAREVKYHRNERNPYDTQVEYGETLRLYRINNRCVNQSINLNLLGEDTSMYPDTWKEKKPELFVAC